MKTWTPLKQHIAQMWRGRGIITGTKGVLPFDCLYLTTKGACPQASNIKEMQSFSTTRRLPCSSHRVPAIWMTWLDSLRQGLSHWAVTYLHLTFIFPEKFIFLYNSTGGSVIKHEWKDGSQWRIFEALPSVKGGTTKYGVIEYQNRCHV